MCRMSSGPSGGDGRVRLVLDLPPVELSPNKRVHWARKARAVKYYRTLAMVVARNMGRRERVWVRAEARTTFYLPDRRRRDPDNLMAAMKAAWDGLVDARVLADDNQLVAHPPTLTVDRSWPRVEIEITAIEEAA